MAFAIGFIDDAVLDEELRANHRYGRIVLGSESERFLVPIGYWSEGDYERQWREAVRRLCEGAPSACLVTWMYDPRDAYYVRYWALFRDGDAVRVEEHMLDLQEARDFDPGESCRDLEETEDDDEQAIPLDLEPHPALRRAARLPPSQWRIEVDELRKFIEDSER